MKVIPDVHNELRNTNEHAAEATFQHGQQHDHHVLLQVHQFFQELDLTGILQRATRCIGDSVSAAPRVLLPPRRPPSISGPRKSRQSMLMGLSLELLSLSDSHEVDFPAGG